MNVEFPCSQCGQKLSVPESAAGRKAKCPLCGSAETVPGESPAPEPSPVAKASPPPSLIQPLPPAPPEEVGPPPTAEPAPPAPKVEPPPIRPLPAIVASVTGPVTPSSGGPSPLAEPSFNPYASPQFAAYERNPSAARDPYEPSEGNQIVAVGDIFSHVHTIWAAEFRACMGALAFVWLLTLVGIVVTLALADSLLSSSISHEHLAIGTAALRALLAIVLGNGYTRFMLRLARGEPADFLDLVRGFDSLLSVLALTFLASVLVLASSAIHEIANEILRSFDAEAWRYRDLTVMGVAYLAMFILLVVIPMYLWPAYYFVVDGKASFFQSFGASLKALEGNLGTVILLGVATFILAAVTLWLIPLAIFLILPLIHLIWGTAYLMMSNEIPATPPDDRDLDPFGSLDNLVRMPPNSPASRETEGPSQACDRQNP